MTWAFTIAYNFIAPDKQHIWIDYYKYKTAISELFIQANSWSCANLLNLKATIA